MSYKTHKGGVPRVLMHAPNISVPCGVQEPPVKNIRCCKASQYGSCTLWQPQVYPTPSASLSGTAHVNIPSSFSLKLL